MYNLREGFILRSSSVSQNNVKAELISVAKKTLGPDAEKVVWKIEESPGYDNIIGIKSNHKYVS